VTSLLGSVALASVKHIMRDHDGMSAIQHEMRNLPLVTDAQSAEVFIAD
jgi:hypothetical protein